MKRMLINASQPEELRVALVDGQELYDLDVEVPSAEQKKGNIYKGRVSRVEPSLEACFVEYGAERHGFLPLREIAPGYHRAESQPGERQSIRDAISEGQEIIVQVEKEERGTKGAALTTFVSLAGRYLVLMPNNPRAGGVSRRIEGEDRDEIREILSELAIPEGMGVIVRTAGVGRSLEQLNWDLDYLTRIWEAIRQSASGRPAPFLIYQESNVIIRALRDHFTTDIGEVLVDDPQVFKDARGFVEMVMPEHLSKLKLYEDKVPLFTRFQIESQIDAAYQRLVRLPSGGAVVFDTAEALVAVDVNSARATQGSDINETAFNTNLEAAGEIARQLRLRDIGGLIVVDFIDMGSSRHTREVEQKFHQALELDRARVQVGRISRFGLLELSRQRLRPSLGEAVLERCPRCEGKGMIRSVESLAISVLRLVHEEAIKERTARVVAEVPVPVATYLMNEKRATLVEIESRCGVAIQLLANPHLDTPRFGVERIRDDQLGERTRPSHLQVQAPAPDVPPAVAPRTPAPAVAALQPAAPLPSAAARPAPGRGWFARLLRALTGGARTARPERPRPPASKAGRGRRRHSEPRRTSGGRRRRSGGTESRAARSRPRGGEHKPAAPREEHKAPARAPERKQKSAPAAAAQGERGDGGEGGRARTRRGRRGGRRRRGGTRRPPANGGGTAPATQGEGPATPASGPGGEPRGESAPRGGAGEAAAAVPPAAETPRLAELYAREQSAPEPAGGDAGEAPERSED